MPGPGDKTQHTLDELVQNRRPVRFSASAMVRIRVSEAANHRATRSISSGEGNRRAHKAHATYMLCSVIALALAVHSAYGPNHRAECREVMGKFAGMAIPFSLIV